MRIDKVSIDLQRSVQNPAVQPGSTEGAQSNGTPPVPPVQRSDRVQISEAGRELAAQAKTATDPAAEPLSPERVEEVRQRILGGAYNSAGVVEEVARRMLERGDI